jgi:hypothetical protein
MLVEGEGIVQVAPAEIERLAHQKLFHLFFSNAAGLARG